MTKRMRRKSSMRKKSTLRRTNMIHGGNKKKKSIRDLGKSVRKKTVKKKKVKKKMEDHSKQSADLKKEPKKARSRKKSSRRRRNKPKRNTSSSGEYGDRGGLTPVDDSSMTMKSQEIDEYADKMDEIGQHKKADLARKLLLDTQPSNSRKSRRSTPPRPSNFSKLRRYTPPRPSNSLKSRRPMSPVPYNSQELDPWSRPVRKLRKHGRYAQFVNLTEAIKYTERKEKELKRSWWGRDKEVDDVMLGRVVLPNYFELIHPSLSEERLELSARLKLSARPELSAEQLANIPSRESVKALWFRYCLSTGLNRRQAAAEVNKMSQTPPGAGMDNSLLSDIDHAYYVLSDERLRPAYEEFHYNNDNGILEAIDERYESRQILFVDIFKSVGLFRQYCGIVPPKDEGLNLTPYEFRKLKEHIRARVSDRQLINYLKKVGAYTNLEDLNPDRGNPMNEAQAAQMVKIMKSKFRPPPPRPQQPRPRPQ
tara:strand:- start:875 stop:2314 length:1440 start_codon:yes stop_codon:yes gene_type:complete